MEYSGLRTQKIFPIFRQAAAIIEVEGESGGSCANYLQKVVGRGSWVVEYSGLRSERENSDLRVRIARGYSEFLIVLGRLSL